MSFGVFKFTRELCILEPAPPGRKSPRITGDPGGPATEPTDVDHIGIRAAELRGDRVGQIR